MGWKGVRSRTTTFVPDCIYRAGGVDSEARRRRKDSPSSPPARFGAGGPRGRSDVSPCSWLFSLLLAWAGQVVLLGIGAGPRSCVGWAGGSVHTSVDVDKKLSVLSVGMTNATNATAPKCPVCSQHAIRFPSLMHHSSPTTRSVHKRRQLQSSYTVVEI